MKNWFADHKIFAVGGFIAGILTLLGLSSYGINHFVTATLELTLATKTIAKETQISLDSTAAVSDPEKLILSAKQVEKQVMGSKSTDATGIKLVGDKANGAVTLYNKTQATKTFEQGTKISKGNLVFTLNETVEVASSSVEKTTNGEKIEYGKVEAQITASAIGAEYNLAMDAELQIEAYAIETFSATVTKALIGGSSREIRMVALEDRQKLLTDLTAQLVKQANEEFSHEYQDGTSIVPTNQVIVVKNDFDAQIGDEVSIFKLDLELKIKALSYQNIDLGPLAAKVLQDNVPAGYVLDTSKPEILSAPNKNETGDQAVKLAVNLAAQAKPILNIDELKSQIKGKKITEAVNILSSNAAIKEIKITLLPPLVAKFWPILPKDPAKIEIL